MCELPQSDGGFGFVDVIRGAKCYFQQYGQGTGGVAGAGKPSKPLADWRKTSAGLAPPPVCRVAPDVVPQTVKNILHVRHIKIDEAWLSLCQLP